MLSREIKKGTMRQVTNEVFKILRLDEVLLRLLWYPSENFDEGVLHPMDERLPYLIPFTDDEDKNTISEEEYWNIVDTVIVSGEKAQEIEEDKLCRLYIYPGRRRPVFRSYVMAKQEIKIDVYIHEDYSDDYRLEWINDRINELLALERVEGAIGKLDYAAGNPRVAPMGYSKYEHMFVFGGSKK